MGSGESIGMNDILAAQMPDQYTAWRCWAGNQVTQETGGRIHKQAAREKDLTIIMSQVCIR
jgi:hypothetical protein